ncbi:hypothetical protein [Solidesulfovibrio alcoholivorans]|uniref:hypothetical protein n=1 Tax=Solidesulfovibrio alcoholivorans TaxID=81406 RepID=UPI0012EB67D6|nr:hypothetical protein [Solidesulfovibrio alcoholivorans]
MAQGKAETVGVRAVGACKSADVGVLEKRILSDRWILGKSKKTGPILGSTPPGLRDGPPQRESLIYKLQRTRMSKSKYSIKQAVIENPEAACELAFNCIEALSSVLSDENKQVIKESVGQSCRFIGTKLGNIFSLSQKSNKLHEKKGYRQEEGKVFSGSENHLKEDYGNQLEAFMPMIEIIYEMSAASELVWEKGKKESCYVSSFTEDDTEYDCQVFLENNSRAVLDIDVYNDDELESSFCIGRNLHPIHPALNKKLSDLFFFAEDAVLRNRCAETNQQETSPDSLSALHANILKFLEQLVNLTEKKSVFWKVKDEGVRKYRALLKKADGSVIVVELITPGVGSIGCRAAKIVDKKLTKLFNVTGETDCACTQIYDIIERLYRFVDK